MVHTGAASRILLFSRNKLPTFKMLDNRLNIAYLLLFVKSKSLLFLYDYSLYFCSPPCKIGGEIFTRPPPSDRDLQKTFPTFLLQDSTKS